MAKVNISGWSINTEALGDINSLEELKNKHNLFFNLSESEKEKAFAQLWEIVKPEETFTVIGPDEPEEIEPTEFAD